MSSKREKALEERLKKLETTLRGTQAKLVDRDNEIARLTTSGGKPALIQKPDGQAGRNFNLAAALEDGVGMDKKTYRKYYALIVFYIMELFSVCGTLSQHSEAKVKAVIATIQKRLPIFQRFQDGWPIRAIFAQLLRNYHERRKRLERSLKVPLTQCGRNKKRSSSAIDAQDAPANSEDEFAADREADDPEDDADDFLNNDHVEIEFDYSDLKAIDTTVNEGEGVASSSKITLEDMPQKPVDKGKARARDTVSVSAGKSDQKDKTAAGLKKPKPKPKPRAVTNLDAGPDKENGATSNNASSSPPLDLPDVCPASRCNDALPDCPSDQLLSLILEMKNIAPDLTNSEPGSYLKVIKHRICSQIKTETKQKLVLDTAIANGWPLAMNMNELRDRLEALDNDIIIDFAGDHLLLGETPLFLNFLAVIGHQIHSFADQYTKNIGPFSMAASNAKRIGYYGPKAALIFDEILAKKFAGLYSTSQATNLINAFVDEYATFPWDTAIHKRLIFPNSVFVSHILTPFVANILISEDLKVDEVAANAIRLESSDFGDVFNNLAPAAIRFPNVSVPVPGRFRRKKIPLGPTVSFEASSSYRVAASCSILLVLQLNSPPRKIEKRDSMEDFIVNDDDVKPNLKKKSTKRKLEVAEFVDAINDAGLVERPNKKLKTKKELPTVEDNREAPAPAKRKVAPRKKPAEPAQTHQYATRHRKP
ncbi:hypothetical protein GGX14DRAFT_544888 [Mycena pura]|uniref:Restriction of telomere capping protein 4 C-terminal domain-containing protein n=1 Tax=Mycena pura TaxID=153505 RepID=A0AAD6V2P7_9AGAR|nr:hypothetical protein GGX14DRAFT_544888 [Mycena pura]